MLRKLSVVLFMIGVVLLPAAAAVAQEEAGSPSPDPVVTVVPPPDALIEGDSLVVLLMAVVISATILMGVIARLFAGQAAKEGDGNDYLNLIQGMVLVAVVVAVIILGVSGKVTQEGLASVLAAIVGFAVGRATVPHQAGAQATP